MNSVELLRDNYAKPLLQLISQYLSASSANRNLIRDKIIKLVSTLKRERISRNSAENADTSGLNYVLNIIMNSISSKDDLSSQIEQIVHKFCLSGVNRKDSHNSNSPNALVTVIEAEANYSPVLKSLLIESIELRLLLGYLMQPSKSIDKSLTRPKLIELIHAPLERIKIIPLITEQEMLQSGFVQLLNRLLLLDFSHFNTIIQSILNKSQLDLRDLTDKAKKAKPIDVNQLVPLSSNHNLDSINGQGSTSSSVTSNSLSSAATCNLNNTRSASGQRNVQLKTLNIPIKFQHLIIGARGETINQLQAKYSVVIRIPTQAEKSSHVTIDGESSAINAVLAEIAKLTHFQPESNSLITAELNILQAAHGGVIGARGSTLARLEQEYNVAINIPQRTENSNLITVEAYSNHAILNVKIAIEKILRQTVTINKTATAEPTATSITQVVVPPLNKRKLEESSSNINNPSTDAALNKRSNLARTTATSVVPIAAPVNAPHNSPKAVSVTAEEIPAVITAAVLSFNELSNELRQLPRKVLTPAALHICSRIFDQLYLLRQLPHDLMNHRIAEQSGLIAVLQAIRFGVKFGPINEQIQLLASKFQILFSNPALPASVNILRLRQVSQEISDAIKNGYPEPNYKKILPILGNLKTNTHTTERYFEQLTQHEATESGFLDVLKDLRGRGNAECDRLVELVLHRHKLALSATSNPPPAPAASIVPETLTNNLSPAVAKEEKSVNNFIANNTNNNRTAATPCHALTKQEQSNNNTIRTCTTTSINEIISAPQSSISSILIGSSNNNTSVDASTARNTADTSNAANNNLAAFPSSSNDTILWLLQLHVTSLNQVMQQLLAHTSPIYQEPYILQVIQQVQKLKTQHFTTVSQSQAEESGLIKVLECLIKQLPRSKYTADLNEIVQSIMAQYHLKFHDEQLSTQADRYDGIMQPCLDYIDQYKAAVQQYADSKDGDEQESLIEKIASVLNRATNLNLSQKIFNESGFERAIVQSVQLLGYSIQPTVDYFLYKQNLQLTTSNVNTQIPPTTAANNSATSLAAIDSTNNVNSSSVSASVAANTKVFAFQSHMTKIKETLDSIKCHKGPERNSCYSMIHQELEKMISYDCAVSQAEAEDMGLIDCFESILTSLPLWETMAIRSTQLVELVMKQLHLQFINPKINVQIARYGTIIHHATHFAAEIEQLVANNLRIRAIRRIGALQALYNINQQIFIESGLQAALIHARALGPSILPVIEEFLAKSYLTIQGYERSKAAAGLETIVESLSSLLEQARSIDDRALIMQQISSILEQILALTQQQANSSGLIELFEQFISKNDSYRISSNVMKLIQSIMKKNNLSYINPSYNDQVAKYGLVSYPISNLTRKLEKMSSVSYVLSMIDRITQKLYLNQAVFVDSGLRAAVILAQHKFGDVIHSNVRRLLYTHNLSLNEESQADNNNGAAAVDLSVIAVLNKSALSLRDCSDQIRRSKSLSSELWIKLCAELEQLLHLNFKAKQAEQSGLTNILQNLIKNHMRFEAPYNAIALVKEIGSKYSLNLKPIPLGDKIPPATSIIQAKAFSEKLSEKLHSAEQQEGNANNDQKCIEQALEEARTSMLISQKIFEESGLKEVIVRLKQLKLTRLLSIENSIDKFLWTQTLSIEQINQSAPLLPKNLMRSLVRELEKYSNRISKAENLKKLEKYYSKLSTELSKLLSYNITIEQNEAETARLIDIFEHFRQSLRGSRGIKIAELIDEVMERFKLQYKRPRITEFPDISSTEAVKHTAEEMFAAIQTYEMSDDEGMKQLAAEQISITLTYAQSQYNIMQSVFVQSGFNAALVKLSQVNSDLTIATQIETFLQQQGLQLDLTAVAINTSNSPNGRVMLIPEPALINTSISGQSPLSVESSDSSEDEEMHQFITLDQVTHLDQHEDNAERDVEIASNLPPSSLMVLPHVAEHEQAKADGAESALNAQKKIPEEPWNAAVAVLNELVGKISSSNSVSERIVLWNQLNSQLISMVELPQIKPWYAAEIGLVDAFQGIRLNFQGWNVVKSAESIERVMDSHGLRYKNGRLRHLPDCCTAFELKTIVNELSVILSKYQKISKIGAREELESDLVTVIRSASDFNLTQSAFVESGMNSLLIKARHVEFLYELTTLEIDKFLLKQCLQLDQGSDSGNLSIYLNQTARQQRKLDEEAVPGIKLAVNKLQLLFQSLDSSSLNTAEKIYKKINTELENLTFLVPINQAQAERAGLMEILQQITEKAEKRKRSEIVASVRSVMLHHDLHFNFAEAKGIIAVPSLARQHSAYEHLVKIVEVINNTLHTFLSSTNVKRKPLRSLLRKRLLEEMMRKGFPHINQAEAVSSGLIDLFQRLITDLPAGLAKVAKDKIYKICSRHDLQLLDSRLEALRRASSSLSSPRRITGQLLHELERHKSEAEEKPGKQAKKRKASSSPRNSDRKKPLINGKIALDNNSTNDLDGSKDDEFMLEDGEFKLDESIARGSSNDASEALRPCFVCFMNSANTMFKPCNHLITCSLCAAQFVANSTPCSICGQSVDSIVHIS
jgi:hypothetical protein